MITIALAVLGFVVGAFAGFAVGHYVGVGDGYDEFLEEQAELARREKAGFRR